MDKVQDFLKANGADDIVHQNILDEASVKFNMPPGVIEEAALNANLLPARYQRNRNTLSIEQQYALFKSRVVVIGCGGRGGHVIEGLARRGRRLIGPCSLAGKAGRGGQIARPITAEVGAVASR
jgi:hypothetical protein